MYNNYVHRQFSFRNQNFVERLQRSIVRSIFVVHFSIHKFLVQGEKTKTNFNVDALTITFIQNMKGILKMKEVARYFSVSGTRARVSWWRSLSLNISHMSYLPRPL